MPPIGPWLFFIGALPGIVSLIVFSRGSALERALPWLSLAVPFAVLALAEQTKAVLYAFFIVPALSVSLACGLDALLRDRIVRNRVRLVGRGLQVVGAVVLIALVTEGFRGYRFSMLESTRVTPYHDIGRRLVSFMPEDRPTLGAWRWWWALADRRYSAVSGFWMQSRLASAADGRPESLREEVKTKRAGYLIVDRDFLADLDRMRAPYRLDAVQFIETCTTVAGLVEDRTYGRVEVRRIACPASAYVP